jgi:hypothetical protein
MEHIIHLPEFKVVVCKKCQYAILPSQMDSHFTPEYPHGFTKETREEIMQSMSQMTGLIQDKKELTQGEFPFPMDTSEPIVALKPPKAGGLRCTFGMELGVKCSFVGKNIKRMEEHSMRKHGWKSTNKGGRPRQSDIPREIQKTPWRSSVQYQQFFAHGAHLGYFEVNRTRMDEGSGSGNTVPKTA